MFKIIVPWQQKFVLLVPYHKLEPREGIEPPIDDYKSSVIPFNYRGVPSHQIEKDPAKHQS